MGQLLFAEQHYLPNNYRSFSNGTLSYFYLNLYDSISLNTVNFMLVWPNSANVSATLSLGIYSLTGGTLNLANSASFSTTGSNVTRWESITSFSSTQNMSPGTWYIGLLYSSTNALIRIAGGVAIPANNAFPGNLVAGALSASTTALPSSQATSDLDITGNEMTWMSYILISA